MKSYDSKGNVELTLCATVKSFLDTYLGEGANWQGLIQAVEAWYGDHTVTGFKQKAGYSRDFAKAGQVRTPTNTHSTLVHARSVVGEFWAWQDRIESWSDKASKAEKDGLTVSVSVVKLPDKCGFRDWLNGWKASTPKTDKPESKNGKGKTEKTDKPESATAGK